MPDEDKDSSSAVAAFSADCFASAIKFRISGEFNNWFLISARFNSLLKGFNPVINCSLIFPLANSIVSIRFSDLIDIINIIIYF